MKTCQKLKSVTSCLTAISRSAFEQGNESLLRVAVNLPFTSSVQKDDAAALSVISFHSILGSAGETCSEREYTHPIINVFFNFKMFFIHF